MVLSFLAGNVQAFERSQFADNYRRMKAPVYALEFANISEVLGAWRIAEPGLLPLGEWHGLDKWQGEPGEEDQDQLLDLYGVLVTKV